MSVPAPALYANRLKGVSMAVSVPEKTSVNGYYVGDSFDKMFQFLHFLMFVKEDRASNFFGGDSTLREFFYDGVNNFEFDGVDFGGVD